MRTRCLVLLLGLAAGATALAQPRRVALEFSGTTSASPPLIQDVVKNLMAVGDDKLDCPQPDAVIAEALPAGFLPADPEPQPKGAGDPLYENWTVSFCGNDVPFLLTFWTLEEGGTAFSVKDPFEDTLSSLE